MSIRKPLIGFTLFAIVSLMVTWVMWGTLQRSVQGGTHTYHAIFSNVLGLSEGDDVRIAGVRVGRVDGIELTSDNRARVTLRVQDDQHLYDNTAALVRYQNLIGQRYVALERRAEGGSSRPLSSGATIGLDRTEPSFDISLLLGGFEPLFKMLEPAEVNELSSSLLQALQGSGVSLASFITQAASVATEFQQRDAIIGDVITNLSGVLTGLANRGTQLQTLIGQTRALISGLYAQGNVLKAATDQVSTATDALLAMVTRISPKIQATQNATTNALAALIGNGARLDRTAVQLPVLLTRIAGWNGQGAYATNYTCSLDVSLWGLLLPPGLLSQVGGNSHSAVCQ
ncbi:MAG: MCE family protein [Mycobacteriaceae bacterium]|nr:MCE family protein [Mycobacteriaceae bacterium]